MNKKTLIAVVFVIVNLGIFYSFEYFNKPQQTQNVTSDSELIRWFEDEEGSEPLPERPKSATPQFIAVAVVSNREKGNSAYADIINHSRDPFLSSNKMTNAHETTHDINSYIRNNSPESTKMNGLYVRDGRGVLLYEPKIRKQDVIPFIPPSLISYRYSLYITGQKAWDDRPLYILDEAISYWNGGFVAVEEVQQGRFNENSTDAVSGCIDFSIYSIALAMAVEQKDPGYWKNKPEFRTFLVWYLKGAEETFKLGSEMKQFNGFPEQFKLLKNLNESPDADNMRKFIKENLDGVWLK